MQKKHKFARRTPTQKTQFRQKPVTHEPFIHSVWRHTTTMRAFYMYIECEITSDTIGCIFLTQKTAKLSDGSGSWENHSIDEEKAFQGGTSEESEGSSDKGSSPDEREAEDVLWVHVVNQPGDDDRQAEDDEPNPDDRGLKTDW